MHLPVVAVVVVVVVVVVERVHFRHCNIVQKLSLPLRLHQTVECTVKTIAPLMSCVLYFCIGGRS